MWAVFVKGGPIMVPIALLSVLGVAVIIEKIVTLRPARVISPDIVNLIEQIQSPGDVPLALRTCERYGTPFAAIMRAGLEAFDQPLPDIRQAMEDTGRREVRRLERYMVVLETVAAASPLLGLLGTVLGMIDVFSVISIQGVGQTGRLAGGIAQALITTAAGLSIGIPALVAYNVFDSRIASLVMHIDEHAHALIQRIAAVRRAGAPETPSVGG